jgi:hypothetical protein
MVTISRYLLAMAPESRDGRNIRYGAEKLAIRAEVGLGL